MVAEGLALGLVECSCVDLFECFGDVVGLGSCDEIFAVNRGEERRADSACVGISEECEGGDSHDEGFAGGGCACVWEGVEGEVEVVVGIEVVLGGWGEGAEVEAGLVDALGCEALDEFCFEFGVGEL